MITPPKLFVINNRFYSTFSKKISRYELRTGEVANYSTPNASLLWVTENERNIRNKNLERNFVGVAESLTIFLEFTTNLYSSYVVVDDNTKRSESKRMLNTECEARFFSVGG
jgi:hypothetical protein